MENESDPETLLPISLSFERPVACFKRLFSTSNSKSATAANLEDCILFLRALESSLLISKLRNSCGLTVLRVVISPKRSSILAGTSKLRP